MRVSRGSITRERAGGAGGRRVGLRAAGVTGSTPSVRPRDDEALHVSGDQRLARVVLDGVMASSFRDVRVA